MLVLSRKIGERIMIGEGIEVMVTEVKDNRVKLGIVAPHDTRIVRGEIAPSLHGVPCDPLAVGPGQDEINLD